MTTTIRRLTAAGSLALLAACGAAGGGAPRWTVADSAGVTIVESAAPAWEKGRGWRVGEAPVVFVPSEAEGYQLSWVFGALRLRDGSVVVANRGENRLLFFGADGRLLRSAGREGAGPGEFRDLASLFRTRGDSLLAHDWRGMRVSVWDRAELGRMAPLRAPDGGLVIAWGAFGDGSLLLSRTPYRAPDAPLGLRADSAMFFRAGPDAEPGDTLGVFPWRESYRLEWEGRVTYTDPPFSRYAAFLALPDGFVVGPALTAEIEVYDTAGRLRRIIRFPGSPRTVTDADIAIYRRERIKWAAGYGAARGETERLLARLEYPARMPAYSAIRADPDGNLWIDTFDPDPTAPRAWRVLAPTGEYLGEVVVPAGFELLDVGHDYVLGKMLGALDEESVAVYPLVKE